MALNFQNVRVEHIQNTPQFQNAGSSGLGYSVELQQNGQWHLFRYNNYQKAFELASGDLFEKKPFGRGDKVAFNVPNDAQSVTIAVYLSQNIISQ